jgi:hypothetical protein
MLFHSFSLSTNAISFVEYYRSIRLEALNIVPAFSFFHPSVLDVQTALQYKNAGLASELADSRDHFLCKV